MTNFDKWRAYTSGLPSPQSYIDWAWIYTISAALQRRVWTSASHQQCFPNLYVIFVGEPGIGKGLVIRDVADFLKFWKLEVVDNTSMAKNDADKAEIEMRAKKDLEHAQDNEHQGKVKGGQATFKENLIPVSADAITYQALVDAVGNSYRRINYYGLNSKGEEKLLVYGHSSLCFVLQELASLMRKQTNDVVNYLLGLYDCPLDYEYVTLTRGKDRVRRGCLNLLAGTTPSFMQSTFDDHLVDEGFSSRTFYIYANKNRKNRFRIPSLSLEQEQYKIDLLNHVRKLTMLYGELRAEESTWEWMEEWWDFQENNKHLRKNKSLKMKPYYSRKNIHVQKVAMALHFSEDAERDDKGRPKNIVPLETFHRAIELLEKEETNMHCAMMMEGNHPVAKVCRKVLDLLSTGRRNFVDLLTETYTIGSKSDLEDALTILQLTNQVSIEKETDTDTDQNIQFWKLVKL